MARGIFGAINKMADAAERASREQARERSRLVKENERHARLTDDGGVFLSLAAIANAIHHDTGRRLRDLPIRIEHLL